MGWWSEDILGGDGPLDELYAIEDRIGIDELYPLSAIDEIKRKRIVQAVEDKTDLLIDYLSSDGDALVLAAVILSVGANLDHRIKDAAIKAVDSENPLEDNWCNPEARQRILKEFREILVSYNGTPTQIEHTGLMEQMHKLL